MIDKSKLKELALAATPGPWFVKCHEKGAFDIQDSENSNRAVVLCSRYEWPERAEEMHATGKYMAAANPAAILELLAELEALEVLKSPPDQFAKAYSANVEKLRKAELRIAELESALATTTSTEPKGDGITDDTEAIQRLNEPKGQDSHVMPPFAAPAGQHNAAIEALRPFAELAELFDPENRGANMPGKDSDPIMQWPRLHKEYELTVGHLRMARDVVASRGAAQGGNTKQVGCERSDGLLNIHPESETCEVCSSPTDAGGLTPAKIADIADRTGFMLFSDVLRDDDGGRLCIDFAKSIEREVLATKAAQPQKHALRVSGTVCEIGDLEDENGSPGVVLKRMGGFVTIKGLERKEVAALGPCFMDEIAISFGGASPAPSAKQEPGSWREFVDNWMGEHDVVLKTTAYRALLAAPSAKQEPIDQTLAYESALEGFISVLGIEESGSVLDDSKAALDKLNGILAAPSASASPSAPIVPQAVRDAVARMCQPLDESRLSGATAKADAFCMGIIKEFIDSLSAAPVAGSQQVPEVVREALEIAHDLAVAEAERVHETYKGYKPDRHAAVDVDVQTVKDAIAVLAAAPAVPVPAEQGWISVEVARRPEKAEVVLVAVRYIRYSEDENGRDEHEGYEVTEGEYIPKNDEGGDYFTSFSSPHGDQEWITHWMPLPAAPSLQQPKEGAAS